MDEKMIRKAAPYLKERSTWLGLVSILTALGFSVSPEDSEVIVSVGLALGGVVAIIFRDDKKVETRVVQVQEGANVSVSAESVQVVDTSVKTPELDKILEEQKS